MSWNHAARKSMRGAFSMDALLKVVAIGLLLAALASFTRSEVPTTGLSSLPPMKLATLDGGTLDTSELHGQVIVLNFFATWCGPCRAEMPDLNAFAARQDPSKVRVVAINAGSEQRLDVKAFSQEHGIQVPVALEGEGLLSFFRSDALPTTVIISPRGEILTIWKGMVNEAWLDEQVAKAQAS